MDIGVDVNHPALSSKYLGYFKDCVNDQEIPYDDHGHGTHTMGTILGGDGFGEMFPGLNDVGVAYNAKFVAAKAFNQNGQGTTTWILCAYEWFANLVGNGLNLRIVSNSWGSSNRTSLTFWEATLNWRNTGLIPIFAIGNGGPYPFTDHTPGNYPIVIGVGATNSNDNVAYFSLRGPAPNQFPWTNQTYWPRGDWNRIKPNISAPGVGIRSCYPGGGYVYGMGPQWLLHMWQGLLPSFWRGIHILIFIKSTTF